MTYTITEAQFAKLDFYSQAPISKIIELFPIITHARAVCGHKDHHSEIGYFWDPESMPFTKKNDVITFLKKYKRRYTVCGHIYHSRYIRENAYQFIKLFEILTAKHLVTAYWQCDRCRQLYGFRRRNGELSDDIEQKMFLQIKTSVPIYALGSDEFDMI
jgi:hypothetical protein